MYVYYNCRLIYKRWISRGQSRVFDSRGIPWHPNRRKPVKNLEVLAGFDQTQRYSLTTKGTADISTSNEEYDKDAEKVMEFLNKLPCGVVDRVYKRLRDSR